MITAIQASSQYNQIPKPKIQSQSFGQASIQQNLAPVITQYKKIRLAMSHPKQTKPGKCYLIACVRGLMNNKNEKNIFKKAISKNHDGSYSVFYKGINKTFSVSRDELNSEINRFALEKNPTTRIFETASRKMLLSEHFWKRFQKEPLKFYSASLFFKKFTGKIPISTGEFNPFTFNNPINFLNKQKALKILDKISDSGEGNFTAVAGTQFKRQPPPEGRKYGIRKNHYYVIKSVDKENKIISVENPRLNEPHPDLTYEQFFDVFRSIVCSL